MAVLAAVNLIAVGLVAAPSQAQTVTCNGTLSDQTIAATVVVPAGGVCQLVDVVVDGRTDVLESGNLFLNGSRIMGSFTVGVGGYAEPIDSRVDGMTTLHSDAGMFATRTRFNRLVDGQGTIFIYSDDSTHWGGIRVTGGENIVRGAVVIGSIFADGVTQADLFDTAVFGPVTVSSSTFGSVMCHMGAALSVSVSGSGGDIHIGVSETYGNCGFNLMGSLAVNNNIGADIQITRNVIGGNLSCSGNDPAPHGSLNLVGGSTSGQCASLSPAPSPSSMTTEETLTAPRLTNVLAMIEQMRTRH
ncbi:MAG: hypothetical protein GEV12_02240 [Micromonosporaceae bacterium]|nr:hypothetical protein [Micromonosporaceae bacterium]